MRYHLIAVAVGLAVACGPLTARGQDQGTFVGGTLWYQDEAGKLRPLVEELHLVGGPHGDDPGPSEPRLDSTHSSGNPAAFVLGTSQIRKVVTVLYYPYPRSTTNPQKFLPRVVYADLTANQNKWRKTILIVANSTSGQIAGAEELEMAIADVLAAARVAESLKIGIEAALDYDLKVIAAKTPAEKRQEMLGQVLSRMDQRFKAFPKESRSLILLRIWADWLPKVRAAFNTDPEELSAILKRHRELLLPQRN